MGEEEECQRLNIQNVLLLLSVLQRHRNSRHLSTDRQKTNKQTNKKTKSFSPNTKSTRITKTKHQKEKSEKDVQNIPDHDENPGSLI